MKLGIFGYDDTCIKIYDPEQKDPANKLITTRDNYNMTSAVLGITPRTVQKHCIRKTQVYSPALGKRVAVRLSARENRREVIAGDIQIKNTKTKLK